MSHSTFAGPVKNSFHRQYAHGTGNNISKYASNFSPTQHQPIIAQRILFQLLKVNSVLLMSQSANADQFIHKLVPSCCSIYKNLRIYSIRAERKLPGTLPQAILGDTWIAVAAEAQFAASMSVAASTDAGIANAAVLLLLLHHCINSGTLTFCGSALIQSAVSQQLWQQENFFF